MAGHPQAEKYKSRHTDKVFSRDARKLLDIDNVDAKCDAIVTASKEGCENLCDKINKVEIGKEALCVADSSLEPALEEAGNYIKSITTEGIEPTTEEIKSQAASKFEELQDQENEKAEKERDAYDAQYEKEHQST